MAAETRNFPTHNFDSEVALIARDIKRVADIVSKMYRGSYYGKEWEFERGTPTLVAELSEDSFKLSMAARYSGRSRTGRNPNLVTARVRYWLGDEEEPASPFQFFISSDIEGRARISFLTSDGEYVKVTFKQLDFLDRLLAYAKPAKRDGSS